AIVHRIWQANRADGAPRPLVRAIFDRRLILAAAVASVLFVAGHNLLFNWRGFVEHVRFLTGGGSQNYRVFEPTIAGRAALAAPASHVRPADRVAFVFPRQYYPRLEPFRSLEILSVEELEDEQPTYFVLNAEYGRSEPAGTPIGRLIAGLQGGSLGYERVYQY